MGVEDASEKRAVKEQLLRASRRHDRVDGIDCWIDDRDNVFFDACIVSCEAKLGHENLFYPYSFVSSQVTMGSRNRIFCGAIVGGSAQTKKDSGNVIVGNSNMIFEYATISCGVNNNSTRIGNRNIIMTHSHIGHDCNIGNNVTIGNYAQVAGHVSINDLATIGAFTCIRQRIAVGGISFIIPRSEVRKHIRPFQFIGRRTNRKYQVNIIGMRRYGMNLSDIRKIEEFLSGKLVPWEIDLHDCDATLDFRSIVVKFEQSKQDVMKK